MDMMKVANGIQNSSIRRILVCIFCAFLFSSVSFAADGDSETIAAPQKQVQNTEADDKPAVESQENTAGKEVVAEDAVADRPANPYAFESEPDKAQLESAFNKGLEQVRRSQWAEAIQLFEAMLAAKNVRDRKSVV